MEKKTGSNPNIILIVIDALRARNLGCYGGEAESSPNIDSIAKKGILFEKMLFLLEYNRSESYIHIFRQVSADTWNCTSWQ